VREHIGLSRNTRTARGLILASAFACALGPAACAHPPARSGAAPETPAGAGDAPELVVQQGTGSLITELATDPQNRLLASVSFDGVRLWDLRTGRILRAFPPLHPGTIDGGTVRFSADGRTLVNASERGAARAFDLRTGAPVAPPAPSPAPRATPPQCRRTGMDCVALDAPDGRSEIIATQSSAALERWQRDLSGGSRLPPAHVELRSLPQGRLIRAWTSSTSYTCEGGRAPKYFCDTGAHFTDDGRLAAIELSERSIVLANVRDGTSRIVTLPSRDSDGAPKPGSQFGRVETFTFAAGGRVLAVGDDIGDIDLFDVGSGTRRTLWDVRYNPSRSGIAASPNAQWLVTGVGTHSELWDLATGQPALDLRGACEVTFSPDSRLLACVEPQTLTIWNAGSEVPIGQWRLPVRMDGSYRLTLENKAVFFSADGTKLFDTIDAQPRRGAWTYRYAYLLDIATHASTRIGGTLDASVAAGGDRGRSVSFMEVGGTVRRYTFATGALATIGKLPADAFPAPPNGVPGYLEGALSPDGHYAAMLPEQAVNDPRIGYRFFDIAAVKQVPVPAHTAASLLGFSPDAKAALFADQDGAASLVEIATGRTTHRYAGHTDEIYDAAYAGDGGTLLTAGRDNTVRIWDAARDRQLGQLFPGAGGADDWLIAAENGSFDGSPGGWNAILWRFGGRTFDVAEPETFFNDFFSPGLLSDLVRRHEPSAATLATIDRRSPRVSLESVSAPPYGRTARIRVTVAEAPPDGAHPRGSGALDVRLLRNGSLVHLWPGDVLRGNARAALETTVKLTAGTNDLQAYAFNGDGVRSAPGEIALGASRSIARRGAAYVLAIGVNRYANPNFALRYAASDADAFARELGAQQARLYGAGAVHVATLTDERATKRGIRAALAELARRAQPEDAVYVYFAGHGVAYGDRYYLVPHDLGYSGAEASMDSAGFDSILAHSLSDLDLAQALLPLDARRIVLVIDACESGEALGDVKKIGPMNAKGLAQLAYEKGMYVLAASQGDQAALESSAYKHGLLTYALVEEALRERRAVPADSPDYLVLRQWLAFAQRQVPALQLAMMQSAQRAGRSLAIVPGEERTVSRVQDRSLQRPRVFDPPYADTDGFLVAVFPPSLQGPDRARR
jgi:WD40 repeat protein